MGTILSRPGEKLSDHIWRAYRVFEETFGKRFEDDLKSSIVGMILLHDIAKADSKFQEYLNSEGKRRAGISHSPLSAFVAYVVTKNVYVAYAIYYHHQDMKNLFSFGSTELSFEKTIESSYINLPSNLESLKDQSGRVLHMLKTYGSDVLECMDLIYKPLDRKGLKNSVLKVLQDFSSSRSKIEVYLKELHKDLWEVLKNTSNFDRLLEAYRMFRLYYSVLKYCDTVSVFMGDKLGEFSQNKASGV